MKTALGRPSRWLLLLAVLALFAAACGGGAEEEEADPGADAGETPAEEPAGTAEEGTETAATEEEAAGEPQEGGTVVFGLDQEPAILNSLLSEGNLVATSNVVVPMFEALWLITPEFEYVPWLLEGEPETTEDPFSVTYTLKQEAAWSDGEPITAEDVAFTYETIMNEEWEITSRSGYDLITDFEIVDDKTITFNFEEPYAPWRTLFSTASGIILPQHVLEGENFNRVWNNGPVDPESGEPIASGPFLFESWNKGQELTLVRNEGYYGEHPAYLDRMVYRFIEDSNTQVQALRGDEIDMFYPQPQIDLVEQVEGIEGVELQIGAGPQWEHYDFQFTHPLLSQQFVRTAIAMGTDRAAIAQQLIAPMYPDIEVLENVIYVPNQQEYVANPRPAYDPEGAMALLEENGCQQGDDGIYTCDDERLAFQHSTTTGNELRELQQQVFQQQMNQIGIEIQIRNHEAAVLFADPVLNTCNYEIIGFAWVGSPDPSGGNTIWTIDGIPEQCSEGEQGSAGLNYMQYENEQVTELINSTDRLLDAEERAAAYNEADAIMAEELPVLPLYQKPTMFAWSEEINGPQDNATQQGPLWNAGEWWIEQG